MLSKSSSDSIHACRVVAATLVVLSHSRGFLLPPYETLETIQRYLLSPVYMVSSLALEARMLFIVLSGFFVGGSLFEGAIREGRVEFGKYYRKRLIRIWTVLIPILCITAVASVICLTFSRHLPSPVLPLAQQEIEASFQHNLSWRAFFGNLAGLQPNFVSVLGINGPIWTLGFIMQFYYLGPFLASIRATKVGVPIRVFFILIVGGYALVAGDHWVKLFLCWIAGALLWVGLSKAVWSAKKTPFLASMLLFSVARVWHGISTEFLCALASILLIGSLHGGLFAVPENAKKKVRWFSRLTFAVYGVHFPIMCVTAYSLKWTFAHFHWVAVSGIYPLTFSMMFLLLFLASMWICTTVSDKLSLSLESRFGGKHETSPGLSHVIELSNPTQQP